MLNRRSSFILVTVSGAIALVGGLVTGLGRSPDMFLPRLKWSAFRSILKDPVEAKRRIKRITCSAADFPSNDYPNLVVEVKNPTATFCVDGSELPFVERSSKIGGDKDAFFSPRLDWTVQRCIQFKLDYREVSHLSQRCHPVRTFDVVKDGFVLWSRVENAPQVVLRNPRNIKLLHEAQP